MGRVFPAENGRKGSPDTLRGQDLNKQQNITQPPLMSLKFALPLALATACLPCALTSQAATYTESGDAGDLLPAAQLATGPAGTALTAINGALTLTNGISDSDLFQIVVSSPTGFSATTTGFVAGRNNFDTQLALFSSTGLGVVTNDDAAAGGSQSAIAAGSVTLTPGTYYLLISGSGRYATSAGGLIFPNYTDGTTDPTGTYGPTGAGGTGSLSGYTGNSNEGGAYTVALTGAQVVPAVVPEPTSLAALATGLGGLLMALRRRTAK